ncbi:MAG: UDP-glucose/GDP-mannose dehydrogenase family protein [Deltaproteobacteria bacterium]|nr:UDP-glucose/GDP-mannose dehydrogenase family protein [Deltaproteobacteria bacterium]MCD6138692.1 UDP-glucose/GDP-mannose dehydrogenase family protein [Deltaproteobacteria bacterium]
MNICVVGVGYVGLVTGTCFSEFGLHVTCVGRDPSKIKLLRNGEVPIYEPGLKELIRKNMNEGRLSFTTDIKKSVQNALVIFIAVGTPSDEHGAADLKYVKNVAEIVGQTMNGYKVVVTKSTVPVGTGKMIETIIKENQPEPCIFDVASNPEFLREGSAIEDFMRPNRIVIGAESEQAIAILKDLYSPLYLIETPFVITDVATAEMIKYASNAFLATKISFINEMATICELVGADVHKVAKGMGLDRRIGPKFLHPGPGFGGSCFPKDTRAISQIAKDHGYEFKIVDAVIKVNEQRPPMMVEKIASAMGGDVDDALIGVLGLTFKPNTDDMRESPVIPIINGLLEKGAKIQAYDPAGMEEAKKYLPGIAYKNDLYEAAEGADALVLATEWNQFRNIDWERIKSERRLKRQIIIDLRNIYKPERMRAMGFEYTSIGRP